MRTCALSYINNNDFHHLGRSHMCPGACCYFSPSKPHSGTLWPMFMLSTGPARFIFQFMVSKNVDTDDKFYRVFTRTVTRRLEEFWMQWPIIIIELVMKCDQILSLDNHHHVYHRNTPRHLNIQVTVLGAIVVSFLYFYNSSSHCIALYQVISQCFYLRSHR